MASASSPTRLLILNSGSSRVSIPVSASCQEWVVAETLREEFSYSFDPLAVASTDDSSAEAVAELAASFIAFVAEGVQNQPSNDRTHVLKSLLSHFTTTFLSEVDIHNLTATYDQDVRKRILSSYFLGLSILETRVPSTQIPRPSPSALFQAAAAGDASLYAIFGGQGTNEVYFDEFQVLYDIYKPYVTQLITAVSTQVLQPLAQQADLDGHPYYAYGLDVLSWLNGSSARPPLDYLVSIPVSLPLIGLTQLVQYLVTLRVANLTPGEFRSRVAGTTGHSQGIVSAVVIAASDSFDSYTENVLKATKWLFYMGLRGQEFFPVLAIEQSIVADCVENGEGAPSPMLNVSGLGLAALEAEIKKTNKHLPANSQLGISLYNGPKNHVVTGPPRALYGLVTALRKIRAPGGADQSKIPFSQRKAVFSMRFLTVNVPYHSEYLKGATDKVFESDLEGVELWSSTDLEVAVYHTESGEDLRSLSGSLTRSLCDQIFVLPIHWAKATNFPDTATHAIDFGPGGLSGIGGLTARNLEGRGVRVLIIGEKGKNGAEVYDVAGVKYEKWWSKSFQPALVKSSDGKIHIDTPFSRLLGKPPIMVAGMTPTTVKAGFVSAVLSAGYHIELAGGGHYNAKALRAKVAEIQSKIPSGVGITLNALYINQRQFGFQFPLWQELRREGLPIEGFCVAAGIPSTEKAAEIISALQAAGIKHIAFKPGSVDGIRQVVNIAAAHPNFPVILQWTGGRAGGHHSYEDIHQPILATYGAIRQQSNISLIAGSGFGGSEDVWPYMTGDWSLLFGVQPMPFDGVLYASRVMVAKEAHTSLSVKKLICAASGVDDSKWEGTYTKETGGILTVRSELGEPIHKVATRAVKLWKEYDETVFKLPKDKRVAWLSQNRDSVISRLNKDFAKPWFGQKKDGSVAVDIGDMTYEEVSLRMVRLMYVAHESRWIDISLRNLTGDWLRRVEERFAGVDGKPKSSILQSYTSLDSPSDFIAEFFNKYPLAAEQLVASEDRAYFLAIAQRPGQKPAPFIPVLDASFEVWFKKDSLWAAEDIEAVFDQDPQRVCILQGPVAAKHCQVVDEPIADLLGNIQSDLTKRILERYYSGDESTIPTIDYIGAPPAHVPASLSGVKITTTDETTTFLVGTSLPSIDDWLNVLAGPELTWLRSLLTTATVVQGTAYIDNPLRRVFSPRKGQRVTVVREQGLPVSLTIQGSARSHGPHQAEFEAVKVSFDDTSKTISVVLAEERTGSSIPLELTFLYRPDMGYAPIHEVIEGRNKRIKDFYWKLWFGDDESLPAINLRDTFTGPEVTISQASVERFCNVIGNQSELFKASRNETVQAPMDFAIVTGWQAIMKAIFPDAIDGDLLKLVHLSNGFRILPDERPLQAGDVCNAEARIISVTNTDSGKAVRVKGNVLRAGKPVIEVTSSFLYRGAFTDYPNTFEIVDESPYAVELKDQAAVAVLQEKEWFEWDDPTKPLLPGTRLIFHLQSDYTYKDKATYSEVAVEGKIFVRNHLKQLVRVGTVEYANGFSHGNPVLAYLQRHGTPETLSIRFENGGYSLTSPNKGCAFAGHSLGEYSALASIADTMPIASLVDVVFYRGITMQRAVERDSQNRSNYAMCAVNPSRISPSFNDSALREVVESISRRGQVLLEIVNFNVEGQQYVCAGELVALQTLTNVLNFLKKEKIDIAKLTETYSVEKVKEMLQDIVDKAHKTSLEKQEAEGYIKLERGFATIPLPGIDVPFHSRYLWAGVMPFRAYLSKKINPVHINPDLLVGKYVPNLIAEPFQITREYAQKIYDQTSSPRLDKVLKSWESDRWESPDQRQQLTYTILVELLAYQFASPVRWIETQDLLFTRFKFERFIEIGPSPTLTGMAVRTLKAKYETQDGSVSLTRSIFCSAKNVKEIYYQFEDEIEAAPAAEAPSSTPAPAASAPAPVVATTPAPVAASSGPVAAIADEPIKAVDTLRVIIAQKLKKSVSEVPLSKSIKDLVNGKSTLQNEILGDLQAEFASAPEKGEELPLEELGSALNVGYPGSLGKYTSGMISRMIGAKMPGGFNLSAVKAHLSKTWGLGPARSDGVLLLAVTMEPAKRLGAEGEAKAWLDTVVAAYAQQTGIALSSGGGAGGAAGGSGGAVMNSEEFLKFQAKQYEFARQQVELHMRYLDQDTRAGHRLYDDEKMNSLALQKKLDDITKEHGDYYVEGIQPAFEPLKARHFDSCWNWARQDALLMFYDIIFGRLTTVDRDITSRCIAIMNRADPALLQYMQYHIDNCSPERGETYKLAKEFGQQLIDNCREVLGRPPVYKDVTFPTAPRTEVTAKGDIVYSEVVRENVRKLEAYVEEMASGDAVPAVNLQKVQEDVLKLWNVVKSQPEITEEQKGRIKGLYDSVVRSLHKTPDVRPARVPSPRNRRSSSQFLRPHVSGIASVTPDHIPLLHLKRKVGTAWEYSSNLTGVYLDILHEIATSGTTFEGKNALITGVGKGSIGVEILKGLLSGGAHVVVTTSRYSRKTVEYYQSIYQQNGSRGSALTVVPFNQASKQDVEALVDYIYNTLNLDLDYVLPFAALPENGREIDGLDEKSEVAHRIMLVNVLRLLGAVKQKKASRHIEMAFNILGLMHPLLFSITQVEPIWADLSGGMDRIPDLAEVVTKIRLDINQQSDIRRAVTRDTAADYKIINGVDAERVLQTVPITPRANFKFDFPKLESVESLADLSKLQGLIDLEKVIVVTGFAELGPWGNSRTRWEMEARGEFTIEGCIEMAWLMGYIKHFDGRLKTGELYVGWTDAKSGEPVDDKDVKAKYEKDILAHSGIRLIEPELFKGYDPKKKVFYQEIVLNHDLEAIEVSSAEAARFKLLHGDKCDAWALESGEWMVRFKKGARVSVPKAVKFDRLVAGQIPTGWYAGRYGIPEDIAAQTDRTALWALACTAEALVMSGITDPYELYKYVHPSEVGTSLGSGMGGMQSLQSMFIERREEKDVQKDILQETFINTVAGWVNLLLLSSSGPIKIPVGACATALQSIEIACDTILSGKAKVMVAGGFDDFSEEGSYEFANMKATSNAETEFAMGREPNEFSRPTTSTRAGFMESQGTGVHILMSAKTALEMGAAIRGIVGFTSTSTDKAGRSIPAPGRGALSIARELPSKIALPTLDIDYRARQLTFRRKQISQWMANELEFLKEETDLRTEKGLPTDDFVRERTAFIESEAVRQEKEAVATFGMLEGADPRIAPLRRALAVWGLTADDIGVVSFHGTSTMANDSNESSIYNDVLKGLSRTPGNAVPVIAQKHLTGHPKGGAAAWMFNGLAQSVNSGIVPGNRNADNVDGNLRKYEFLVYPSKSIHTDGIKAGLMTSFGFGQVGGTALIIHPRYLFSAVDAVTYGKYKTLNQERALHSYKTMSEMMITNSLVKIKEHPPFTPELELPVLMNPLARVSLDKNGELSFGAKQPTSPTLDTANVGMVKELVSKAAGVAGVGVDQELISSVPSSNPTFVSRNYTDAEVAYCQAQPNPAASFAARWAGKEAVFKSLGASSKGAGAAMKDIEILPNAEGVPEVHLHGDAKATAEAKKIAKLHVSLSHSDTVAIAFAQASF
ncbi:3-oxoacyl-[acyl-carrier-protein] synthase [Tulasnella sp. 403]|nr:3-oxoacyl-[acyl-carrier-protein] synthase [Tulasnella sp. 403]